MPPHTSAASNPVRTIAQQYANDTALAFATGAQHAKRKSWWAAPSWPSMRYALMRSVNRTKLSDELFVRALTEAWSTRRGRNKIAVRSLVRRAARVLADDLDARASFESLARLGQPLPDYTALWKWVEDFFEPPPPTEAEQLRATLKTKAKAREKKRAHVVAMLKKHQAQLAREERAVARWTRRLRALDAAARRRTAEEVSA